MKLQKLTLYQELFFEEINVKFLVHKSLINEDTRDMILKYMESGKTQNGIHVNLDYDIYCFEPVNGEYNPYMEENDEYLWFAL